MGLLDAHIMRTILVQFLQKIFVKKWHNFIN